MSGSASTAAATTATTTTETAATIPTVAPETTANAAQGFSGAGFCASEYRVSEHTCNSLHPAIALDKQGNQGITWQDNRDGNFEIYFRSVGSKISTDDVAALNSVGAQGTGPGGRSMDWSCSGFSGFSGWHLLSSMCQEATDETAGSKLRRMGTSFQVDQLNNTMFLTDADANYGDLGVGPGMNVSIETGKNSGKSWPISSVVGKNTLSFKFDPEAVNDTNFVYLTDLTISKLDTCEVRVSCNPSASLFPDIVADDWCRNHIVFHDDLTSRDQIYYSQIARGNFMSKCGTAAGATEPGSVNLGFGGWSPVRWRPNVYTFKYKQNPTVKHYYAKTGEVGQRVSYGLCADVPAEGTHKLHQIFKDDQNKDWIGASKYYDREEWDRLIAQTNPLTPPIVYGQPNGIVEVGDFGSSHAFKDLAFLAMTPPDLGIEVETLCMPILPKCVPAGTMLPSVSLSEQDIVEAPKRPLPPTFVDPVSMAALLDNPMVTADPALPARFTLVGDDTGTVYTNLLVEDARGQLNRLVFAKQQDGRGFKFILSMRKCGDGPCAVKPSAQLDVNQLASGFSMTIQVWRGPDYRVDPTQTDSAMVDAEKVLEKIFPLSPGDDMTKYSFSPGELVLNRGSMYFFVAIPSSNLQYMTRGTGGGNIVWYTDEDGKVYQYNIPYTVPPYDGLNAPIYYDGYLTNSPRTDTETQSNLDDEIPEGAQINCPSALIVDPGLGTELIQPFATTTRSAGLDYSPTLQNLVIQANYPSGSPYALETVDGSGNRQKFSDLAGSTGESNVCVIQTAVGGFAVGEVYLFKDPNIIVKVSADGATITDPWATIPADGLGRSLRIQMTPDEPNLFGGGLIAVTTFGNVYKVASDGSPTLVATIADITGGWNTEWMEGLIVLPSDARYGPWSGKVVIGTNLTPSVFQGRAAYLTDLGQQGSGILTYTVDPAGAVGAYNMCIAIEDIKLAKKLDLYAMDYDDNLIYKMAADQFEKWEGDIIVSQESRLRRAYLRCPRNAYTKRYPVGEIYHLKWNPALNKFVAIKIADLPNSGFDEIAFGHLSGGPPTAEAEVPCTGEAKVLEPILVTASLGENRHPSVAVTPKMNLWAVWHSTRNGTEDIYAARFFGRCSVWNSSGQGGQDLRVTYYASDGTGRKATFPRVASDAEGNAHIAYQLFDPKTNHYQIYYVKSTGPDTFTEPVQVTSSPGDAMMPDITVTYDPARRPIVAVVWHDNRFGNWEVMSAKNVNGIWFSSGFGGEDTRVTATIAGDSMFPRIKADKDGNFRVVFHSNRGQSVYSIYMATYLAAADSWSSSGSGASDIKVSNGPADAMFPDIDIDSTGGVAITWQDNRHATENPDQHEEVYATYCPKLGHPTGVHYQPILITNIEQKLDLKFDIVSCSTGEVIEFTNTRDVCLRIKAPNATFWHGSNGDGQYSDWSQFKPNVDLDTTVVPWKLSCGNGLKTVCVQVQDQQMVAFPICNQITLVQPPETTSVTMYSDSAMTALLPTYGPYPVAKEGDVWVRIISPNKILNDPLFDVVHKGTAGVFNQQTDAIDTTATTGTTTTQAATQTVEGHQIFGGRFRVSRDDGFYHRDGLARLIVKSGDPCIAPFPVENAPPPGSTDNISVPPAPAWSGAWSGGSGAGTWTGQPFSMPLSCSELAINIPPTVGDVPWNAGLGAIAQPFVLAAPFAGGAVTLVFKLARRRLPDWLSAFSSRKMKVSLLSSFPGPFAVAATAYINATDVPEVDYDVISGLMEDPASAADIADFSFSMTLPAMAIGPYAIMFEDESFNALLGEYGANAKLFLLAVGTTLVPGESPYFLRDY